MYTHFTLTVKQSRLCGYWQNIHSVTGLEFRVPQGYDYLLVTTPSCALLRHYLLLSVKLLLTVTRHCLKMQRHGRCEGHLCLDYIFVGN